MSNPFITSLNTNNNNIKVNNIKPNLSGNIILTISDIPDLQDQLNAQIIGSTGPAQSLKVTDSVITSVNVGSSNKPNVGDSLVADSTSGAKWT